ncbi:MAG: hypothetical protein ABJG15_07870 [Hyphomonadaceae bacterium]
MFKLPKGVKDGLPSSSIIGALLVVLALVGLAIWMQPDAPTILEKHENQATQKCTQTRHASSDPKADTAGSVSGIYEWTCDPEDSPQYQENKNKDASHTSTDADLLAQERVAYWTRIIAALTALGIGILGWTLYETRSVGTITRDIGEAQVRAYIHVQKISVAVDIEKNTGGLKAISFQVIFNNLGQSPAINLRYDIKTVLHEELTGGLDDSSWRNFNRGAGVKFAAGGPPTVALNDFTPISDIVAALKQGHKIYVVIWLQFEDVFKISFEEGFVLEAVMPGDFLEVISNPNVSEDKPVLINTSYIDYKSKSYRAH